MGQWGEGNVTGRLTTSRAILAVQFWGEAMQGAGPHVLRRCGGVWSAGSWRAALWGCTWRKAGCTKDQLRYAVSQRSKNLIKSF